MAKKKQTKKRPNKPAMWPHTVAVDAARYKLEQAVVEAALKCSDDIIPNRLQAAINALRAHRQESA